MTARSKSQGHDIIWCPINRHWVYADTGEPLGEPLKERPCSFCKNQTHNVLVKIPADLSSTGFARWKYVAIDCCIASIVDALQKDNIDMRGSCCGHGKTVGEIHLQDGRVLIIADDYAKWDKVRNKVNKLMGARTIK